MAVAFDSDLFDAEVVLERMNVSDCDAIQLGRVLASLISPETARQKVERLLAAKKIPRPALDPGKGTERRWSRQQVLEIVAQRLVDEPHAQRMTLVKSPSKHAPGPRAMGNKRRCPTHYEGQGAMVAKSRFRPGKNVCRECERREVRVAARSMTVELIEGDKCVGHDCPVCGLPFEIGERITGESLHHATCAA